MAEIRGRLFTWSIVLTNKGVDRPSDAREIEHTPPLKSHISGIAPDADLLLEDDWDAECAGAVNRASLRLDSSLVIRRRLPRAF